MNEGVEQRITWDNDSQVSFQKILEQIPELIRGIAEARVTKKAESLVREAKRLTISEKDMVDAFFAETPSGFIPVMKSSMTELGIDFEKYGYKK